MRLPLPVVLCVLLAGPAAGEPGAAYETKKEAAAWFSRSLSESGSGSGETGSGSGESGSGSGESGSGSGEMPSLPPPSPPPPPPCPSAPPGASLMTVHVTKLTITAPGAVNDYTDSVKDQIAANTAASLSGVDASQVKVFVTAGSVIIDIQITTSTASAASAVQSQAQTSFATGTQAAALINSNQGSAWTPVNPAQVAAPTITVIQTQVQAPAPPPPPINPPSNPPGAPPGLPPTSPPSMPTESPPEAAPNRVLTGGAIAGIVVAVLFVITVGCFAGYKMMAMKGAGGTSTQLQDVKYTTEVGHV